MAHFSKFIWPNSIRIGAHLRGVSRKVKSLAFLRPDNRIVVILYNGLKKAIPMTIRDKTGTKINIKLKKQSINTIVYSPADGTKCPK